MAQERELHSTEVIDLASQIRNLEDFLVWFSWIPWYWQTAVVLGLLGMLLIIWRFIWATLPYSD